jgi:glycosyltransferase involved in cell wall biosynthesis
MELSRAMSDLTPTRVVSVGPRRSSAPNGKARLEIFPQSRWRPQPANPLTLAFLPLLAKSDVVHCHQFHYRLTALAIIAGFVLRKRIFVTDLGGLQTHLSRRLKLSRLVTGFLNLTRFSAEWLGTQERSTIIYGGVDVERFTPPVVPTERTYFLYVGRLLPHKGIDVLVRAVGADMPLIIAGRPYDQRYYRDLLTLAEGKQVRFILDADDTQLVKLYQGAIAVVLPSVTTDMYGEPHGNAEYLGLTLLEGAACGAVPVCSAVGGMPEIVEDGVTGFVVPQRDPEALRARLVLLRSEPSVAQQKSARALQAVLTRFTWHKVAERCLAAYRGH